MLTKMSSLQHIIRKKYLACAEHLKKSDLVSNDEYKIVSRCNLNELLRIESNPTVLEQICEGEIWQTTEYYNQQEKKYRTHVAKIYRQVKPKLPRIVEVEDAVPVPASDNVPESAAIPAPFEPTDAIRESSAAESNSLPPVPDPYQMVHEPPQPEQPIAMPACDENFGSRDVDGTRDFLELCTGINFPPMTLAESSAQQLLLAELGIPVQPLNDNFQEIDLRGIGMPLFQDPPNTSVPVVEAGAAGPVEPPENLEHNTMATTNPPVTSGGDQLPGQQPDEAGCVAMPALDAAPNVATNEVIPLGRIPEGAAAASQEVAAHREETVQDGQNGVAVATERRSSSVSPVIIEIPNPRPRRVTDFTSRAPPLVDILPRSRTSFDIFTYHHRSNLYPMIEYVQSQMFQQQPEAQLQTPLQALVDSVPVMRAVDANNATRETSSLHESNDQGRAPNVTTAVETSHNGCVAHPIELSQLPDQLKLSDNTTNVPLITSLAYQDGPIVETSERLRLPSLVTTGQNVSVVNESNAAKDAFVEPGRPRDDAGNGIGLPQYDLLQPQDNLIWEQDLYALLPIGTTENIANKPNDCPANEQIDTMLLDILILIQHEMTQHLGTDRFFVPVTRIKELLKNTTRIDAAKLFKNIILLRQAHLIDVTCAEDNSIGGISIKFPPNELEAMGDF